MPLDISSLDNLPKYWDKVLRRNEFFIGVPEAGWRRLEEQLKKAVSLGAETVVDLGCGTGVAVPQLSKLFKSVVAVDFATEALAKCEADCKQLGLRNVRFIKTSMTDLECIKSADVVLTINSLTLPLITDLRTALGQVRRVLQRKPGLFLGVLPSIDSRHYEQMVLIDFHMKRGLSEDEAKNHVIKQGLGKVDFRMSRSTESGPLQHFWTPHEIEYRLVQAGFERIELSKLDLSWETVTHLKTVRPPMPPWDWFFTARITDAVKS